MSYTAISLRTADAVAWLTLDRPAVMNAMNLQMVGELSQALESIAADDSARVVVLTGNGRAFCAGADLADLLQGLEPRSDGSLDFLDRAAAMYNRLRAFPKPVVGALNGLTMAGGLELALCCDILIAAASARIGDGHANFGVFPGAGGAAILPIRVGLNMAKYLLFSGKTLPASDYLPSGFVTQVVDDAELAKAASALALELTKKSPLALRRMKEVVNATIGKSTEDSLRHEIVLLRQHLRSRDMSEGLAAFKEKRAPDFKGC